MFERGDESDSCALFQDIEPQIAFSSLDVEYTGDMFHHRDSSLE